MNKRAIIIREISRLAERMFGNGTGEVYLYGSQAREDHSPFSDWDILVITDDSVSTNDDFRNYVFPYAEIGWRYGAQITPIHYTRSQWNAEKDTAFYHNVLSEARRL